MKKILLTITAFLVTLLAVAQSPNLLNYQGVARNSVGNVLPSQPIGLRLSILSGGPTGPAVYTETRNVTTNAFGLFNVQVGSPGAITTTGTIAGINWAAFGAGSGTKFLQVEIDPLGGTSYFNVGSTQLVSVPYALYAAAAAPVGPAGGDLTGTYPNPQIAFPLIKTFSFPTNQLIGMTNSSPTGTLGAITGTSASNDASATAILGTMSSTSPGGFSAAVRGVNNGSGGLGIGVYGSQAGSGWGVYGTSPNGFGVYGLSTASTGVLGQSTSGAGVFGTSNTSNAGSFQNTNAASTANAVDINVAGTGYALRAASTNAAAKALQTAGALQLTGIGEAAGRVLTSDATGNATWQAAPGSLFAGITLRQFSSDVSIPTGIVTPITKWQTIMNEDGGSNYNSITGQYTIPVAGVYQVNAQLLWRRFSSPAMFCQVRIHVNGSFDNQDTNPNAATGTQTSAINYARRFAAGDMIQVQGFQNSVSSQTLDGGLFGQNFSIQFLHN